MPRQYRIIFIILAFAACKTKAVDTKEQINRISKSALIDSLRSFEFYDLDSMRFEHYDDNLGSRQLLFFEAFSKKYSEKELVRLANHSSPIIRCYSSKALVNNSSPYVLDVLFKHLRDTAYFLQFSGCLSDDGYVTNNYLEEVGYADWRSGALFQLKEDDKQIIDSILLFGNEIKERSHLGSIKYYSRRYALERLRPKPHFHKRTRELVNAGVYEALPLLEFIS